MVDLESVTPTNVNIFIAEPRLREESSPEAEKFREVISRLSIGVHVLSYLFIGEVLLKVARWKEINIFYY